MRFDFARYQTEIATGNFLACQIAEEMLLLFGFLSSIQPHHIIEVGTAMGGTFVGFCMLSTGKKISIDMVDTTYSCIAMPSREKITMSKQHRKSLKGVDPGVVLIDGDSTSNKVLSRVREVLGRQKADFVFIDGDHSAEGSWRDYKSYLKFVSRGGWIGFHDIVESDHHKSQGCYVSETWEKVKPLHKRHVEILGGGEWGGIGLVQNE